MLAALTTSFASAANAPVTGTRMPTLAVSVVLVAHVVSDFTVGAGVVVVAESA